MELTAPQAIVLMMVVYVMLCLVGKLLDWLWKNNKGD